MGEAVFRGAHWPDHNSRPMAFGRMAGCMSIDAPGDTSMALIFTTYVKEVKRLKRIGELSVAEALFAPLSACERS